MKPLYKPRWNEALPAVPLQDVIKHALSAHSNETLTWDVAYQRRQEAQHRFLTHLVSVLSDGQQVRLAELLQYDAVIVTPFKGSVS